jgi:hypothetical protein
MMDWKSIVGPVLQSAAPKLAKGLLGQIPVIGPMAVALGGEMIDDAIGKLIAETLGVEATPEAVNAAIQEQPTDHVIEKLKAAEAVAETRWPAIAQIITSQEQGETARLKASVQDTANARARDLEIRKLTGNDGVPAGTNIRANVMLAGAFTSLLVIVLLLAMYRADLPDGIAAILGGLCGSLATMLTQAFNFEFGSSRGSSEKSNQMMGLLSK